MSRSELYLTEGKKENKMTHKTSEHWMHQHWRPLMEITYIIINIFDFIIFPFLWSMLQAKTGVPITEWQALTLTNGGLFHIAMGSILAVASHGRTLETLSLNNTTNNTTTTANNAN